MNPTTQSQSHSETAVRQRYGAAAQATEPALCCPVQYNPRHLEIIPSEVMEKDYGCGDPSRHLEPGETVLDLGSGTGKIAFISAQVVGPTGRVIGVDMTDEMLDVARRNAPIVAERLGYANVEFRKGRIQDLGLSQVRIIWAVILPQSLHGLVTGSLLGLARAAGETAPILFTAAIFAGATIPHGIKDNPVLALPYHIFVLAQDSLSPEAGTRLWGAALVLLALVLGLSLAALPMRLKIHEEARHD